MTKTTALRLFPYRGFSKETIEELRSLLGEKLPVAMPSLLDGAGAYVSVRDGRRTRPQIRRQLQVLGRLLRQIDVMARKLSVESRRRLNTTYDEAAITREAISRPGEPPALSTLESLNGLDALSTLLPICNQTQRLVEIAMQPMPRKNTPQLFLAVCVAAALSNAGAPISKGQSGLFARVLQVVWHDVDPDEAPDEVFRHLKKAADLALKTSPHLRPRKGRPSKAAKKVRSATS